MHSHVPLIPAVYLIIQRDSKYLLIERKNTGWADGKFSLVSGHVEDFERPKAAAVREAKEEAGITVAEADLVFAHVSHRVADEADHERVDYFFEVKDWQGEVANCEPDKCAGFSWHSLDALPDNMVPHVRDVLSMFRYKAFSEHSHPQ